MDAIFTWALAFALLTGDPEKPAAKPSGEAFQSVRQPMATLALEMQILDQRETRFVLVKADELPSDLAMLRRRAKDLRATPRLAEAERFPPLTQANELLVK